MPQKILFFNIISAIPEYALLFTSLAKKLGQDKEFSSHILSCKGLLGKNCISHQFRGLSNKSKKAHLEKSCQLCHQYNEDFSRHTTLLYLDDYYDETDSQLKEDYLAGLHINNIETHVYEGIPLAKLSSLEFILDHKIFSMDSISEKDFALFKSSVANTLTIYQAAKHFFEENHFDHVVFYQNYSFNNIVIEILKTLNIRFSVLSNGSSHASVRYSFYLASDHTTKEYMRARDYFVNNYSELTLPTEKYPEVLSHIDHLVNAKLIYIYSQPRNDEINIHQILGIDANKPTYLLSMSSSDEVYGTNYTHTEDVFVIQGTDPFQSQLECIQETIDYFHQNPDKQLIIRIHPREYPNQREKAVSRALNEYDKLFAKLPENVVLNIPEQNISIYNLFEIINLNIVAWSSVGIESLLFGIPTISSIKGHCIYPIDFIYKSPNSKVEFFSMLDQHKVKIDAQQQLDIARKAMKFQLFKYFNCVIRCNPHRYWEETKPSFAKKLARKFLNKPFQHDFENYYENYFTINDDEFDVIKINFLTGQPIYEIKNTHPPDLKEEEHFAIYWKSLNELRKNQHELHVPE